MGRHGLQLYDPTSLQAHHRKRARNGGREVSSSLCGNIVNLSTVSKGPPNSAALARCKWDVNTGSIILTLNSFSASLVLVSPFCTVYGQHRHPSGLRSINHQESRPQFEHVRSFLLYLQSTGGKRNHCAIFLTFSPSLFRLILCLQRAERRPTTFPFKPLTGYSP